MSKIAQINTSKMHSEKFSDAQFPMLANAILSLAKEKVQFALVYDREEHEYILSHPLEPIRAIMEDKTPPPLSVA